jgi:hypothetical protein
VGGAFREQKGLRSKTISEQAAGRAAFYSPDARPLTASQIEEAQKYIESVSKKKTSEDLAEDARRRHEIEKLRLRLQDTAAKTQLAAELRGKEQEGRRRAEEERRTAESFIRAGFGRVKIPGPDERKTVVAEAKVRDPGVEEVAEHVISQLQESERSHNQFKQLMARLKEKGEEHVARRERSEKRVQELKKNA